MTVAANKNVPSLSAWVIAGAAGLVAFGVALVIGAMDIAPSAFIGLLICLLVGVFLTIAFGKADAVTTAPAPVAKTPAPQVDPVVPAPEPVPAPAAPLLSATDGPQRLSAPRGGMADDLKEIEGIGPAMEKLVNGLGFYHFDQIANWSDSDVAWVDANMKNFKGRIIRDKWVAQAKIIVAEGLDAFRIRAKTNDY